MFYNVEGNYSFFNPEIENIWYIFECISETTFSSMELSFGEHGSFMLSGESMSSIGKTLETIDFCCSRNSYSDAYTLIRKFRDVLMQYLFILDVIQNKHGLTDEEAEEFTLDIESLMKMVELDISILESGVRKTDTEKAVEKWFYDELKKPENSRERQLFFDASKYKQYLVSENEKINYIFNNYFTDKWKNEDRILNNYVHINGINYLKDNYTHQGNKEQKNRELIETIKTITDIFLSLLSIIDSTKLRSSDYLDALELGLKPQEGSQYWVCPIILEYMNNRFDKGLLQYIRENDRYGMRFFV